MNSTTIRPQMQQALGYIDGHRREADLVITIALFAPHLYDARRHVGKSRRHPTYGTSGAPYPLIFVHIFLVLVELGRWHFLRLRDQADPIATRADVCLAFVSTLVAFTLVPRNKRGVNSLVRPGFLTAGILRCVATTMSYVEQDAGWERASIKLLNLFDISRWLIGFLMAYKLVPGGFGMNALVGLNMSLFLSIWDSNYPGGALTGIAALAGVIYVNDWMHRMATPK